MVQVTVQGVGALRFLGVALLEFRGLYDAVLLCFGFPVL